MFKITFPNDRKFTGVYLSVSFRNGEGETDNGYLAERFAAKGLKVTSKTQDAKPKEASKKSKEQTGKQKPTEPTKSQLNSPDGTENPDDPEDLETEDPGGPGTEDLDDQEPPDEGQKQE